MSALSKPIDPFIYTRRICALPSSNSFCLEEIAAPTTSIYDLPEEIIEEILPEIGSVRDLINLACTSKPFKNLIIPRHSQYRSLHVGTSDCSHVWAHLARRPDLARNIRELALEMIESDDFVVPSTLVESVDTEPRSLEEEEEEMIRAFECMTRLELFKWDYRHVSKLSDGRPHFGARVFDVLHRLGSVERMVFRAIETLELNEPVEDCGLWKMSNLRSLLLAGDASKLPIQQHGHLIQTWLNSLSSLEFLHFPLDIFNEVHHALFFPSLRCFKIFTWHSDIGQDMVQFLARHPRLEALTWFSDIQGPTDLPTNFLPNLQEFDGRFDFLQSLVSHPTIGLDLTRQLRGLSVSWISSSEPLVDDLCATAGFDHHAVRLLNIGVHSSPQDIQKLAAAFPMLEELAFPGIRSREIFNFEKFLLGIEQLKFLKVLYQYGVWSDLGIQRSYRYQEIPDPETQRLVDERIQVMATRCPSLRYFSHPKVRDWRMVIERGNLNGKISIRAEKAPPRSELAMYTIGFWP